MRGLFTPKIDDLAPCPISKARSKEFIWALARSAKEFQGARSSSDIGPQEAVE